MSIRFTLGVPPQQQPQQVQAAPPSFRGGTELRPRGGMFAQSFRPQQVAAPCRCDGPPRRRW